MQAARLEPTMKFSAETAQVLASLRPPFVRSSTLLYPFSTGARYNTWVTYDLPEGEYAYSPGNGSVELVEHAVAPFYTENGDLVNTPVYTITINHGQKVYTKVSGILSTDMYAGASVIRGDYLGDLLTTQLGFSLRINGINTDPSTASKYFELQDGASTPAQVGKVRFAPAIEPRDTSEGVTAAIVNGKQYFSSNAKYLLNINFNAAAGLVLKKGKAVAGFSTEDVWNDYVPVNFTESNVVCDYTYSYSHSYAYSATPWLQLNQYTGQVGVSMLQRIAPLTSVSGTLNAFDPMLQTFVGGVGESNTFNIRNVPPGAYDIYVYSYKPTTGTTSVYTSANGATPVLQTITHGSVLTTWVEGQNYVKRSLYVTTSRKVSVSVYGTLSGLQLVRTSD